MSNPVLVEVLRGSVVESRHRGAVAVLDADGKVVAGWGDIDRPVFPRSAVKAIQALPLLESGTADAYGFADKEIALACASHSAEPEHVHLATDMLARAGLQVADLECGAHWSLRQEVAIEQARAISQPTAAHNNCSGKHAGFLCTCRHLGEDHHGYVTLGHPAQEAVREAMEAVTGAPHSLDVCGTDGCSIPTYAVPLRALARGFARLATGTGLGPQRARAAQRIFSACMAEPFYVAGTNRADTMMMGRGKGRIFTKMGAEGVFCAAVPELGLGIALKCDDGADRASEVMVAQVLALLLGETEPLAVELRQMARPAITTRRGMEVGGLQPSEALARLSR
ncbi:asparaginase [Nitratireductor sp. ZSWI3]|uniref:asparaginase n=1 Tax=Nitratireductor sp. ZSWI3 TaxID=2966359 RepID=UPI00214FDC0E|nr:asparaginase [Nitratireductor sp. ZSWI3]MCR4265304.1 asparaginase [Nitratireductor sp. ZSWI3]